MFGKKKVSISAWPKGEIRRLLPIGSIVTLNGAKKRVMICGVCVADKSGVTYDYLAVLYPEGWIGHGRSVMFQHEDVKEVHFRGFEDEERYEFMDALVELYKQGDT